MPVESVIYSIPYLVMVLLLISLVLLESYFILKGLLSGSNQQLISWFSMSILLLFFGLRGFIGWDWTFYYPAFNELPVIHKLNSNNLFGGRFDPGFIVYTSFIKTIWNSYSFYIFFNTLFDLIILTVLIRRFSGSFAFSCLMFVVMTGFYLETDLLRNAKSIMLFLISVRYINTRKFLPFLALNLLGLLFHFSSILLLPLYFFLHRLFSKKTILVLFIAGLTLFIFQIEYIKPFVIYLTELFGGRLEIAAKNYFSIEMYSSSYGFTVGFFERIATLLLIIIYFNKLKKNKDLHIFINSYVIYFLFFFYFSEIYIIPVRVGGIFAFSYWIIYPHIFKAISLINNKLIFIMLVSLYSIIKIITMTDNILYKYDNVISGIQSFSDRLVIFESVKRFLFR